MTTVDIVIAPDRVWGGGTHGDEAEAEAFLHRALQMSAALRNSLIVYVSSSACCGAGYGLASRDTRQCVLLPCDAYQLPYIPCTSAMHRRFFFGGSAQARGGQSGAQEFRVDAQEPAVADGRCQTRRHGAGARARRGWRNRQAREHKYRSLYDQGHLEGHTGHNYIGHN